MFVMVEVEAWILGWVEKIESRRTKSTGCGKYGRVHR